MAQPPYGRPVDQENGDRIRTQCHQNKQPESAGLAGRVGDRIAMIAIKVGLPEPHSARGEGKTRCGNRRVFHLIELLIVVAIILIIAAIAIPNLLRARIAANESSSVSSVRTINTAEVTYLTAYPTVGYAATLVASGPGAGNQACAAGGPTSLAACLLDSALANNIVAGGKSGYTR